MDMEAKAESKYERLRKIGTGSYGVVFKCVNRQNGQIVAIKRYSENDSDPIIRKIAMREVRMLRQLKHPNLINLIEVFRRKRRLHLVFDYCELTVLDVIEKYGNNCPINLIKKIIWQTVNGINYCHTHNCIHRDIKPENILINQAGVVKLCDFGFARNFAAKPAHQAAGSSALSGKLLLQSGLNSAANKQRLQREIDRRDNRPNGVTSKADKENGDPNSRNPATSASPSPTSGCQALTEYVATRWYRAPELLIGEVYYDIKIDIWAVGCVAAELMRGEPIWPGKTDLDQLCIIKNSLGPLTSSQTHTLLTQSIYDQSSIERLLEQPANVNDALARKLPSRVGQNGIDFVSTCLRMNPAKRPTGEELLKHAYIHSARMTQFIKDANSPAAGQLSSGVILQPPNSVALVKPSTSYGHQLPTITKSRSNSQALKLATSTGPILPSSGATNSTTVGSNLPARQPKRRLLVSTINPNNQSLLTTTTPVKSSSIPLAIATKSPLHGGNRLQQEQTMALQLARGSGADRKSTSPAEYKRKHSINQSRATDFGELFSTK